MATIFADSFDPYGSGSDLNTGMWSTVTGGPTFTSSTPFSVGQAIVINGTTLALTGTYLTGTNETTVYGSVRVKATAGTSGQAFYISFNDAGTAQCTIRWNSDGSIGLYSGGPAGSLLQTYSGVFVTGTWNAYQFKIVHNNSTGSIELRVNGATADTINKTGVNTRAGTSNSYSNGITIGSNANISFTVDDLYMNNTGWTGDIRALQQLPTAISGSQNFTVTPATTTVSLATAVSPQTQTVNSVMYTPFTASAPGTIGSLTFTVNANATANVKFAVYDNSGAGGAPGTVLATSNACTNPVVGSLVNTCTFASPPTVTSGTSYFLAVDQDASVTYKTGTLSNSYSGTTTYASFAVSNPSSLSFTSVNFPQTAIAITNKNVAGVYQAAEDGDTTYISTASITEDQYSLSSISTAYTVVSAQYYVCWRKTDAGSRTAQLSVTANGSSDTAEITNSTLSQTYTYGFVALDLDPTGAAWTVTNVNGAKIGVAVTA